MGVELDRTRVNSGEVARSLVNSGELFNGENKGNGRRKPMNYGKWSKSREVARTHANFEIKFAGGWVFAELKRTKSPRAGRSGRESL